MLESFRRSLKAVIYRGWREWHACFSAEELAILVTFQRFLTRLLERSRRRRITGAKIRVG
jgi:hypothetical protein